MATDPIRLTADRTPAIASLRVLQFTERSRSHPTAALAELVAELERGSPLIEAIPEEPEKVLVTFVFLSEASSVTVTSPAVLTPGRDVELVHMQRVGDSPVWYHSVALPRDVVSVYSFVEDSPLAALGGDDLHKSGSARHGQLLMEHALRRRADPFASELLFPAEAAFAGIAEVRPEQMDAVLALRDAAPFTWHRPRDGVPTGRVSTHRFASEKLSNERTLWVYEPDQVHGKATGLLVLLDGLAWRTVVPAETMLDNLIADGRVAPMCAVLVDTTVAPGRMTELACHEPFADFVADELVPWVRERHATGFAPADVTLAGVSRAGLASMHAAWRRPDAVGNVLSLSGAFWWSSAAPSVQPDAGRPGEHEPEWLARQIARSARQDVRVFLDIGRLETTNIDVPLTSMVASNRHMRDVLQAKGYDVCYRESAGGHDFASWRQGLAHGLMHLAPPG